MTASSYVNEQFFFLLICLGTMSASINNFVTQKKYKESSLQKILQSLHRLDEECRPKEGWNRKSTQRGKLSCRVDGEMMASDMEILIGSFQRAVNIFNIQRLTCENPLCSLEMADRKQLKWFPVSSQNATNIQIESLSHITASGRFSNLVYGVGRQRMHKYNILRFDLADNFRVSEHRLRWKQHKISKTTVLPCGLTTGKCHSRNRQDDVCMYNCYCTSDRSSKYGYTCTFAVFEEPIHTNTDIDEDIQYLSVKGVEIIGRIKSAAADATGKIYMVVHGTIRLSSSMAVGVRVSGHTIKIAKLFRLDFDEFQYIDFNQDGVFLMTSKKEITFIVMQKTFTSYGSNWFKSTSSVAGNLTLTRSDCLACWVHDGNGLVFICKQHPFNRWTQRVKSFQ